MRYIERVLGICSQVILVAATVCLGAMAILVFIEIVGRSLFGFSTLIADEYSVYFMVALVMFGLMQTFRENRFIRMDFFYDRFFGGARVRMVLDPILLTVGIVYLSFLIRGSIKMVELSYRLNSSSIYISETPLWIPQITMPIGLSFLLAQFIIELLKRLIEISKKIKNLEKARQTQ